MNTGIAGTYNHVIKNDDDRCGSIDLYYYDNPEKILQFPGYDLRVTISENN